MWAPILLSSASKESASTRLMPAGRSVTSRTRPISGRAEKDALLYNILVLKKHKRYVFIFIPVSPVLTSIDSDFFAGLRLRPPYRPPTWPCDANTNIMVSVRICQHLRRADDDENADDMRRRIHAFGCLWSPDRVRAVCVCVCSTWWWWRLWWWLTTWEPCISGGLMEELYCRGCPIRGYLPSPANKSHDSEWPNWIHTGIFSHMDALWLTLAWSVRARKLGHDGKGGGARTWTLQMDGSGWLRWREGGANQLLWIILERKGEKRSKYDNDV